MVSIDTSKVPSEKLLHRDFLSLKQEMEQALSQETWINAFCIHEAGHMVYLSIIGVTEFDFIGPRITYNAEKDTFEGYMAAVQPKKAIVPDMTNAQAFLNTAAKAYVAGRVFTKKLTNAPDSGDEDDRQRFDEVCSSVENKLRGVTIDRQKSWEQAEEEVLVDLRSPKFRAKAWTIAKEIKKKTFGNTALA